MFEKSISVLYSICIPFVTVALFMPKTLIRWVAGEMYTDAAPILQVYLVISILGIVQHQSANELNSLGKSKLCFTLNVLGLIIKFMVVSICLILYGLMGAAIGGLITAFINFFVWYLFIKRHIDISWSLNLKNLVDNYIFFYKFVAYWLRNTSYFSLKQSLSYDDVLKIEDSFFLVYLGFLMFLVKLT
jgi:O-antigen/teichoic acid export membrane protein